MIARIIESAEADLQRAFDYYEQIRRGLGQELMDEFRRGLNEIIVNPNAWQKLDRLHRRYRLSRFPYGIIYQSSDTEVLVISLTHLHRKPGSWRRRVK